MDKDQIKDLNEESSDEGEAFIGNISTDWEVDKAGIAYRSGDKVRTNTADLNDEFMESN